MSRGKGSPDSAKISVVDVLLSPCCGVLGVLFILWVTGMADLLLTAWGLRLGVIEEANPLMAWLFSISKPLTLGIGTAVMTAALGFLWYVRKKIAWFETVVRGLLAIRVVVLSIHIYWLLQI